MRKPSYISPTSIDKFYSDRREYYLKYLANERPPKMPQTEPMSVGSAFDAYVKSYLHTNLFGSGDPKFELTALIETQVEEQNRDFAIKAGKHCFDAYNKHGALADLMLELEHATTDPVFEFKVEGEVHYKDIHTVTFSGYPDVYFHAKNGLPVIYDWKVNGFCGKGNTSPSKGYKMLRGDAGVRNVNSCHKDAMVMMSDAGLQINVAHPMETVDKKWAAQLAIYSWLLGTPVGGECVVGIDQLACGANTGHNEPAIRVAAHRCLIGESYQIDLMVRAINMLEIIDSGHIFDDVTLEESKKLQATLDNHHKAFGDPNDPAEDWFTKMSRNHRNF